MLSVPENTRNSYGITYLSKDDAQDHKLGFATTRDRIAMNRSPPSRTSTAGMSPKLHDSRLGQHTDDATGTKFSAKPTPAKPTKDTKTQFSNPNFVSQKIKPLHTGGTEPSTAPRAASETLGGKQTLADQNTERKHGVEPVKRPKSTGTGSGSAGGEAKGTKQLPRQVGDAPKGTPHTEEKIGNRKTRVGQGEKAHETFRKREGVGEDPKKKPSETEQSEQDKARKKEVKIGTLQGKIHEAKLNEARSKLGRGIKAKAQLTLIKSQLLKISAERYVKPSMASAGKNPATKMPNAGGIQNKLDSMKEDAVNATNPKKHTETTVTGSSDKVSDRYT